MDLLHEKLRLLPRREATAFALRNSLVDADEYEGYSGPFRPANYGVPGGVIGTRSASLKRLK